MKYLLGIGFLAACLLSAGVGLTVGINLNPGSTTRYVLNWGSVGDWLSGIGAFSAVALALWQSHKYRKEDVEDLLIDQRQVKDRWIISVVSRGKRPVRVVSVDFYSKKEGVSLGIKRFIFHGDQATLPQTLGYAENIDFVTRPEMLEDLAINAVMTYYDLDDLQIHVRTTLGDFRVPVLAETKSAFTAAIQKNFEVARQRLND